MTIKISKFRREIGIPILQESKKHKVYLLFDVESKLSRKYKGVQYHKPFLICYQILILHSNGKHTKSKIEYVETKEEFYDVMTNVLFEFRFVNLIAHNVGYDIGAIDIFTYLHDHDFKCNVFSPNRGSYYIRFSKDGFSLNIIDNLNYFSGTLAELGSELDIPKLKMPKKPKITKKFIEYCKNDVKILSSGLIELSKITSKYNVGQLEITRAKMTFQIFQKYFLKNYIKIHNNRKILDLEYAAYVGGRTEMFYHGIHNKGMKYYVDFNSLYPSVMRKNKFSTKLRYTFCGITVESLKDKMNRYNAVARVRIHTDIPIFPKKIKNMIIFPVGKFTTVLANAELEEALKRGMVKQVYSGALYHREEIFTEFVDHFHILKSRYKAQNKKIFTYFGKLMLNSLYGKFAQKIPNLIPTGQTSTKRYDLISCWNYNTHEWSHEKTINHHVYKETDKEVSPLSVPIVAAEVTSLARMKLWAAIEKAGLENIFYTDTDSLIVNKAAYAALKPQVKNGKLGYLELENTSKTMEIRGLKDYVFGATQRIKSVPRNALALGNNTYEFLYFATTKDVLSQVENPRMYTVKIKKTMERIVKKGVYQRNKRVVPWRLG